MANWNLEALEISNCFFVKDGKTVLLILANALKISFFIIVDILKYNEN